MITGRDVIGLFGATFQLVNRGQAPVDFTIPPREKGWPRGGLEAYGVPAVCHHPTKGDIPAFLKVFKHPLPLRQQRTLHLVKFGLARRHPWLFSGIPFGLVSGVDIGPIEVHGHVTKFIPGAPGGKSEDVGRLRANGQFDPDIVERARLASHLCIAVEALERLGLVHGDISPANVMIGASPDGRPAAMLCDFDGFHSDSVPPLPATVDGVPIRGVGTPGFQAPHIVRSIEAGNVDVFVDTDRFAMAAMCCELVAWQTGIDDADRDNLLEKSMIDAGSLHGISDDVGSRWPAGFSLLEAAISSRSKDELPSPSDWLALLHDLDPVGIEDPKSFLFVHQPMLQICTKTGHQERRIATVRVKNRSGTFGPVHPALGHIQFRWEDGRFHMTFPQSDKVRVRRGGRTKRNPEDEVTVRAGDHIHIPGYVFKVSDQH